jgi:hypothetical protein
LIVEEFDQLPSCDHLLLWVIDDRIPMNHLLRRINAFMTEALAFVHEQLDLYYSEPAASVPGKRCLSPPIRAARTILCLRRDAMLDARDSLHQFAVGAKVTQGDRVGGG